MIERSPTPLDPLHAGEVDDIPFEFELGTGETITGSPVMSCTVYRGGPDATPAALLSGAATVSGNVVTQRVSGGVAGTVYTVLCRVTTSAGRVLAVAAHLPVINLAAVWG